MRLPGNLPLPRPRPFHHFGSALAICPVDPGLLDSCRELPGLTRQLGLVDSKAPAALQQHLAPYQHGVDAAAVLGVDEALHQLGGRPHPRAGLQDADIGQIARGDPAGADAEHVGPSRGGHGEGFLRTDPGLELGDAAASHDRRHLHLVEHGIAVARVASIGAQSHRDAAVQHFPHARQTAPELGVAGGIVDHRGLSLSQEIQLLIGQVHGVGQGYRGLEEAEPRGSLDRRFAVARPLLRLRSGFHEMSVNGQAPILGYRETLGQEAVRTGMERGGRDHAHEVGRTLVDEVQSPLQVGDLLRSGTGRLPRRYGAPSAVGRRGRHGHPYADLLGGINAGANLLKIDGASSGEMVQDARRPVLEGFQQGNVIGREQVTITGIQDVFGPPPFKMPQLERKPVAQASLQDLGVVRVGVDEAGDHDLVPRIHHVASVRRKPVGYGLDAFDQVSLYPDQSIPQDRLGRRAQKGPREDELLGVHEVGSQ